MVKDYRELVVWQKAIELVTEIYRVTADFPERERFGLVAQLRRAAVSIASNIAEGQGRLTTGEFKHFLGNARGSLCELETQLVIARNLGFVQAETLASLTERTKEVGRLLNGLIRSLGK